MRTIKSCIFLVVFASSCNIVSKADKNNVCNYEKAIGLAKTKMLSVAETNNLDEFVFREVPDTSCFIFEYTPKELRRPGGGGSFKIDKKTCKMYCSFYQ